MDYSFELMEAMYLPFGFPVTLLLLFFQPPLHWFLFRIKPGNVSQSDLLFAYNKSARSFLLLAGAIFVAIHIPFFAYAYWNFDGSCSGGCLIDVFAPWTCTLMQRLWIVMCNLSLVMIIIYPFSLVLALGFRCVSAAVGLTKPKMRNAPATGDA